MLEILDTLLTYVSVVIGVGVFGGLILLLLALPVVYVAAKIEESRTFRRKARERAKSSPEPQQRTKPQESTKTTTYAKSGAYKAPNGVIYVAPEPEDSKNDEVIDITPEPPPQKEETATPQQEPPNAEQPKAEQPKPQEQPQATAQPTHHDGKPILGVKANSFRTPEHNNLPYPTNGIPLGSVYVGDLPDISDKGIWTYPALRSRHTYIIGKTRTGKTTLIKNLALQDIEQGVGLCFVDPHGDAAEDIIGCIPRHRLQDVIYFDPTSNTCPPFNILNTSFSPPKLTEDIVNVLKMFFGSSWGFRMEHILRYAILTLLHDPQPRTLKDLRTLLVNEQYRAEIFTSIQDEAIRDFWEQEFANYPSSAVDPIINKLSSFLVPGSPLLKLFSQPENALDFSRIMNEQQILIVNLSKGLLSEDPSRLLGGLIVTGIQQAALGRAELPPNQRKDFHLYLDEFQNFVVESFESILSEAAKYKLFLTLAHQTLGQVPGFLKHGIFGNVATLIAFQISAEDAGVMQREMHKTIHRIRKDGGTKWQTIDEYADMLFDFVTRLRDKKPPLLKPAYDKILEELQTPNLSIEKLNRIIRKTINPPTAKSDEPELLFTPASIRQDEYPDTADFINQKPRHAFCRMERAENVHLIRTIPAPDPSPAVKAAILQEMKARYSKSTPKPEPKPEPPKAEQPKPQEQPRVTPEPQHPATPIDPPQEAAPKIDPVQAARARRAQKSTSKRSSTNQTPAPQNDDDFSF